MGFKDILVPYDGEATQDKAVDNAIKIAKSVQNSEIILLHVIQEIALPATISFSPKPLYSFKTGEIITPEAYIKEIYHALRKEMKEKLEKNQQKCNDVGISSQIKIEMGDPAEKILEYAKKNKFDLIVMGTERKKGISKYVSFGSVAKKVSEHSPCPIMLIP